MSGVELFRILRSVKAIARRCVNDVSGDESTQNLLYLYVKIAVHML